MVELDNLLKLNPADLEAAIRKGEKQIAELDRERQRLVTFLNLCRQWLGLITPSPEVVTVRSAAHTPNGIRAGKGKGKVRTVDAAFNVLLKAERRSMPGLELLSALKRRGCRIGTMPSLAVMLRRDPRFHKVPGVENVWAINAQAETHQARP